MKNNIFQIKIIKTLAAGSPLF